jgi:hypothetical protein
VAGLARTHASFDDPNLVSRAGLVAVMALAQRAGLAGLVAAHIRPGRECGVNAHLKIPVPGRRDGRGTDSIDDMDWLRHGAMSTLFGAVRAPSTLGSYLRSFTWGNVSPLEMVNRELLGELARRVPLPGKETLAFIGYAMQKRACGHREQGAAFGHTKIQGKSLLVRPEYAGRHYFHAAGRAGDRRGPAARRERELRLRPGSPLGHRHRPRHRLRRAARRPGGLVLLRRLLRRGPTGRRPDLRHGEHGPKIGGAIAATPETAWAPIKCPRAIWDDQLRCWISDAQVAETGYTTFTSKKGQEITARPPNPKP